MKGGIYRITNLITGVMYIGRTAQTFARRWSKHRCKLEAGSHSNKHLQSSYNKYGLDAFEFGVLEIISQGDMNDQEVIDCMNDREIALIAEYDTFDNGYNLSDGGEGRGTGYTLSEEHKANLSKAQRGRTITDSHRAKISAALKGRKPSEATRARISAAGLGRTHSEETRAKISKAHKGRKKSEDHIAKMSAVRMGKKLSEEHKANLSMAHMGHKTSEATKAKIAAGVRAYHARKRAETTNKEKDNGSKDA